MKKPDIAVEKAANSIPEFCVAHGFSQSFYFKEAREGRMPRTMQVGARRLISKEAQAEWRREREAASINEQKVA